MTVKFALLAVAFLAASANSQSVPCIVGSSLPAGCDATRIKPCDQFSSGELAGAIVIDKDTNYRCSSTSPRVRDTVFAGAAANTYFVTFDGADNECLGIIMQAGECWGTNPGNGENYDCQGRCGAGCSNGNSNWSRDCLKHDVCSWYFSATGGAGDSNCGDSFGAATNDFLSFGSGCRANGNSCTPPPTLAPTTPPPGVCFDEEGLTYSNGAPAPCNEVEQYCSQYSIVREKCAETCGECSNVGNPQCADNVPSGLTYNNGNPAPCNEIEQYCPQFDFVRAACPATCGLCAASNTASLIVPDSATVDPIPVDYSVLIISAGVGGACLAVLGAAVFVWRRHHLAQTPGSPNSERTGSTKSRQLSKLDL